MEIKKFNLLVESGKPIQWIDDTKSAPTNASDDVGLSSAIGKTLKAYRESVKTLLNGKYQHLKELAPAHMRTPGNATALLCLDGIFVRYDVADDAKPKVRVASTGKTLAEIAPAFSDNVFHFPSDPNNYIPPDTGPRIGLAIRDQSDAVTREVITIAPMVFGSAVWPENVDIPAPPARPVCLASLVHEFDFVLDGRFEEVSSPNPRRVQDGPTHFLARTRIPLLVGWRAIEVYPLLGKEHWIPEAAALWAELDLLFALVQRNSQDSEFNALDGRAEARRKFSKLLAQFESLLDGLEEPLHQFIKSHPELLCPTYDAVWSKVPFGDRVSDFIIREIPADYMLVEIEAPIRELFRKDGQQRQELTHAIDQINDWLQYIADNRQDVERVNGFDGISVSPRALVVIGRSTGLSEENRKKLTTLQERQPRLRILTYDDVLANARLTLERILGPMGFVGRNVEMYYYTPKTQPAPRAD